LESNVDAILSWLENDYIPLEPSILSPGAMSNAPDRFDGFHSFNRCCRGKADSGRHANNLRSYTTDRRVFEFWSDGDWIAADRLMGLVKTFLSQEPCADGGKGPPTADHVGPLSLGFCHRPEFKLLSKAANSSKNNRMSLSDVRHLINVEKSGVEVASWYAKPLWDYRKSNVTSDEEALRLSKMLRDNQRNAMKVLCDIFEHEYFSFLVYLLELSYANRKVEFVNLRSVDYTTVYDHIIETERNTKYSTEQKARRIRIGFESLRTYKEKQNRHSYNIDSKLFLEKISQALSCLEGLPNRLKNLDVKLSEVLKMEDNAKINYGLREYSRNFPDGIIEEYESAKILLSEAMHVVGERISSMWESDRYVRQSFEDFL
jgi:Alw26I/Eco31I/Esp3I family type II restriction endonuclease